MSRSRASLLACALLLTASWLAACEALLTDPRPPAELAVSFQLTGEPLGGDAAAFSRIRRVALRFVRPDESFRDTVVAALPVDGRIRTAISIPAGERSEALGVLARLGYGTTDLFRGATVVRIDPGAPTTAEVPLSPVAAAVLADVAQLTLFGQGASAALSSTVLFASGDTIEGLQGTWTSVDPTIVAVGPLGTVVAQGLGQTLLEVRLDSLADTVAVDVLAVTATGRRVSWTNASGGAWSAGSNWSTGAAPEPGDSVDITLDGTYTVTIDVPPPTVAALEVGGTTGAQALDARGVSMTSLGDVSLTGTGGLLLGTGTLTTPLLTIGVGARVELGQDAVVSGNVANAGLLELHDGSRVALGTGTLVNAPTGAINTLAGPLGGGANVAAGGVDNQGSIDVSGADLVLGLTGTGAGFSTSGAVLVGTGRSLEVSGGPFVHGTGAVTGAGTLRLVALSGSLATTMALGSTAPTVVSLVGSTLTGQGLSTAAGTALELRGSTLDAPLASSGLLLVTGDAGSSVTGAVTTTTTSILRVVGAGPSTSLTMARGFTNDGLIELESQAASAPARLVVATGSLTHGGTGVLRSIGAGVGQRTIVADVSTTGAIELGGALTIEGSLIDPVGAPSSYSGNTNTLTVRDVSIDGAVFDDMPLVISGALTLFANVTFQNMDPGAVQLSIEHPGAAGPVTVTGLVFPTTPTTGRFMRVTDTDGLTPLLVVEVLASSPASGQALSEALNGASLIW